jgi:hydroxyethylthiazole kinase
MENTANTYHETVRQILDTLRREVPLIQCITNYVTVNDVANALLCLGASPAMVEAENEVLSFLPLVQGLYLNIGTFTGDQPRSMRLALPLAKERNIPVLLDPVACGVIPERMAYVRELLSAGGISLIKGNSAEILSLAGRSATARGVDAVTSGNAADAERELLDACAGLAARSACTVVATGVKDVISDGKEALSLRGGSAFLTRFSGSGCILGGLMCACAAAHSRTKAGGSFLPAALTAAACMKYASEEAAARADVKGPISFKTALLDSLSGIESAHLGEWVDTHCVRLT